MGVAYVAGRPDNEALSAELASRTLEDHATIPVNELAEIYRIIVATRSHQAAPDASHDLRVALDIDMSILGAPRERYEAYARDVRREYCPAVVDETQFAKGRAGFLSKVLASTAIFATEEGRSRWEARARENLSRELAGIR